MEKSTAAFLVVDGDAHPLLGLLAAQVGIWTIEHATLINDEAIEEALAKSGSIITLCGLIMGGTFLTLLVSGSAMLQEIGFALGFAILVDSLLVVPYVVPALMHLMGDWSWKGPRFLASRRGGD